MSRVALLDVNVLVALFDPNHGHHEAAHGWFGVHRASGWATCPLSENGLVRVLSSPAYPGPGERPVQILDRVRAFCASGQHVFWPDDVSLRDGGLFRLDLGCGPRQLTDVYLLGLARRNEGRLVTFDRSVPLSAVLGATDEHRIVRGRIAARGALDSPQAPAGPRRRHAPRPRRFDAPARHGIRPRECRAGRSRVRRSRRSPVRSRRGGRGRKPRSWPGPRRAGRDRLAGDRPRSSRGAAPVPAATRGYASVRPLRRHRRSPASARHLEMHPRDPARPTAATGPSRLVSWTRATSRLPGRRPSLPLAR
jgi:uncharacterized protein